MECWQLNLTQARRHVTFLPGYALFLEFWLAIDQLALVAQRADAVRHDLVPHRHRRRSAMLCSHQERDIDYADRHGGDIEGGPIENDLVAYHITMHAILFLCFRVRSAWQRLQVMIDHELRKWLTMAHYGALAPATRASFARLGSF